MDNRQAQMNMQKLLQEQTELEATYFEQRLNSETFPSGKLSDKWKKIVKKTIMKTAPIMVRCSLVDYISIMESIPKMDKGEQISLFQFGVLSNSLETKSPDELGLSPNEYCEFMQEALELIEYYGKRKKVIDEDVKKRAHEDTQRKLLAQGKEQAKSNVVTMGQA